jgi:hypothetical protein
MGIFDQINFSTKKSPGSTFDLRLLDTPCDHLIRNEEVTDFNIDNLFEPFVYSGSSITQGGVNEKQLISFYSPQTNFFSYPGNGTYSITYTGNVISGNQTIYGTFKYSQKKYNSSSGNIYSYGPIPYNATPSQIQSILESFTNIGTGNVYVTGTTGQNYYIEFVSGLGNMNLPQITVTQSNLGPTGSAGVVGEPIASGQTYLSHTGIVIGSFIPSNTGINIVSPSLGTITATTSGYVNYSYYVPGTQPFASGTTVIDGQLPTLFGSVYNLFNYNTDLSPTSSTIIKTQTLMINDGSLVVNQTISQNTTTPINEETTVPSDLNQVYYLKYPPKTNSVTAKEKIYIPGTNGVFKYVNFNRYTLSQLYGNIEFTNSADIGSEITFTYLADRKKMFPKNQDGTPNYEMIGVDQKKNGIINIYGRGILSNKAKLMLTYKTDSVNCPKCLGKNVLNDFNFDSNGRIQLVFDFSKLIQDFFKRVLTEIGSDIFDRNYGSSITSLIGVAKADGLVLSNYLKTDIINVLYGIRSKQVIQQNIQGLSLGEQIQQINSIDVKMLNVTDVEVIVSVLSKSGQTAQINTVVGS